MTTDEMVYRIERLEYVIRQLGYAIDYNLIQNLAPLAMAFMVTFPSEKPTARSGSGDANGT